MLRHMHVIEKAAAFPGKDKDHLCNNVCLCSPGSLVASVCLQMQGVAAVSKSISWEVAVPTIESSALHYHTPCTSF